MHFKKFLLTAIALLAIITTASAATCPFIEQFGITWTFQEPYPECGKFVNGDHWVIGPVIITDITRPAGSIERDGSMINPIPSLTLHGYDSRVAGYNSSLNVANSLPLTVNPNKSLVSTISDLASPRPVLRTAAVLTVLGDIPPAGSFRPPYAGNEKPIYSSINLRRDLLLNLTPVGSTPALSSVERMFEMPWIDHRLEWKGDYLHPSENMENYGAGIARDSGTGALRLLLNDPIGDKELLLIRYVQLGIDDFGLVKNKAHWGIVGGTIGVGRKLPILFAGLMLDNSEIKNVAINYNTRAIFQEDGQTFYLTQAERDATYWEGNCYHPDFCHKGYYDNTPLGTPSWGDRHYKWLTTNYNYLPGKPDYLGTTHMSTIGTALTVHLLGIEGLWNYDPFLDWMDRSRNEGISSTWGSAFADDMWDTYRNQFGCVYAGMSGSEQQYDCSQCQYNCNETVCPEGNTRQCGTSNVGECSYGLQTCLNESWDSCQGAAYPSTELCTGNLDEDCDSLTDCDDPNCSTSPDCIDIGNYLVLINFEAGNDGTWTEYNPGQGSPNWNVVDDSSNHGSNAFQLTGTVNSVGAGQDRLGAYSIIQEAEAQDFVFEGDIKSTSSSDWRDLGLIVGYQNDNQHYIAIFNNGCNTVTDGIFKVTAGIKEKISSPCLQEGADYGTLNDQQYHHFKIEKQGTSIEVYLDDMTTPVFTADDSSYGLGSFGVGSINDTGLFDNIAITSLDNECISTAVLLQYISSWKQGSLGMLSLMQKLELWKVGTGC